MNIRQTRGNQSRWIIGPMRTEPNLPPCFSTNRCTTIATMPVYFLLFVLPVSRYAGAKISQIFTSRFIRRNNTFARSLILLHLSTLWSRNHCSPRIFSTAPCLCLFFSFPGRVFVPRFLQQRIADDWFAARGRQEVQTIHGRTVHQGRRYRLNRNIRDGGFAGEF